MLLLLLARMSSGTITQQQQSPLDGIGTRQFISLDGIGNNAAATVGSSDDKQIHGQNIKVHYSLKKCCYKITPKDDSLWSMALVHFEGLWIMIDTTSNIYIYII